MVYTSNYALVLYPEYYVHYFLHTMASWRYIWLRPRLFVRLSQVSWVRNKGSTHPNGGHQSRCPKSEPQSIIVHQPGTELNIRRKRPQSFHRVSDLVDNLSRNLRQLPISLPVMRFLK